MTPAEIRDALYSLELTQADVIQAVGLPLSSRTQVSAVIHRKVRSAPIEAKLAELLGKPIQEVFPDWYSTDGQRKRPVGRPRKPSATEDQTLEFPLAVRLVSECERLGRLPESFDPAFAPGSRQRKKMTPDHIPPGPALRAMAMAGVDISYILAGRRRSSVRATSELQALFGGDAAHLPAGQLLGALLCLLHDGAGYLAEANPYPAWSAKNDEVRMGWLRAHCASDAATAQAGEA